MLRRTIVLATAAIAALAVAPSAHAGGWATVNVRSAPQGVEAGQAWTLKVTMLQHGRSPWTGDAPVATFRNGAEDLTFTTTAAAAEPGVFTASVTLPRPGVWTGTLADVFDRARPLAPVKVAAKGAGTAAAAAPAAGDSGGGSTGLAIAIGGAIALAIALAAGFALSRSPRPVT